MSVTAPALNLQAVPNIPEIESGDDLGLLLAQAMVAADIKPRDDDIVVCSQKIVSKAEGRRIPLGSVNPSHRAFELAQQSDKDPALVELILSETDKVMRVRPNLIIVRHRLGMVMANAGIDQSNIGDVKAPSVLLLPVDPDASAQRLRSFWQHYFNCKMAVLIIDSVGRAWRSGVVGLALGCSGVNPVLDLRGTPDRDQRLLGVTQVGFGDQIAAAAALLMGEGAEGRPLVLVRGLQWQASEHCAATLIRPLEQDLFQ